MRTLRDGGRLPEGAVPGGVIYLWGLDAPEAADLDAREVEAITQTQLMRLAHLVRAWTVDVDLPITLVLVTRGAVGYPHGEQLERVMLLQLRRSASHAF